MGGGVSDDFDITLLWTGLKDERDQPRSPSLADVLAKLQEIEEKIDILLWEEGYREVEGE